MVLEAYLKYLSQKPYAGLLSESIKQVFLLQIYREKGTASDRGEKLHIKTILFLILLLRATLL